MRLEYQDDIDKYLLGRMSDEERTLFEAKCAENPELKEQLEHTQDVKAVISERCEMLAKIQEWDNEYDANEKMTSNKVTWIYWLSGIAAVLFIGFFLYPVIRPLTPDGTEELASISREPQNKMTEGDDDLDSCVKSNETERLLAKNEEKEDEKEHIGKPESDQVLSFGKSGFEPANPQGQGDPEHELRRIEEDIYSVLQKIYQLRQQLNEGEINRNFYDSSISRLKYQTNQLLWKKVKLLIELDCKNEALEILEEMRREEGAYRNKADSLYNEIK